MENSNNKNKIISIIVVLAVLALGSYLFFVKRGTIGPATSGVATVNGVVITQSAYDTQLAASISSYEAQGVDVTDATKLSQIKTQVLDNLIGNELLTQAVAAAGIKSDPVEVEKQYQAILTQAGGADGLKAELAQNNLTDAGLRENISKQLAVQTYLSQNVNIASTTATDAEVAQFYADYVKAQKTASSTAVVPALKDLSAQIKQQIISDKQNKLIVDFIDSLRAKAKVEITVQ